MKRASFALILLLTMSVSLVAYSKSLPSPSDNGSISIRWFLLYPPLRIADTDKNETSKKPDTCEFTYRDIKIKFRILDWINALK